MRAGDLNRTIKVMRMVETGTDMYGQSVTEWRAIRTTRANVKFGSVSERLDASQKTASASVVFRTRWQSIEYTDVIQFDGRLYDIQGFAEVGRRVGLEITATWRQGELA